MKGLPVLSNSKYSYHFKTLFISDIHLGTKDCKAESLNTFLKSVDFEELYLVGDIFDGWKMSSNIYWNKHFNQFLRRMLKLSKKGISIYYITGNHDEFLRKYAKNSFENIQILNRKVHTSVKNKRYIVIHGDQFESVTYCSRALKYIGDHGYNFLMVINRWFNKVRAKHGYGYWSFAHFLKQHVKRAKRYIEDYENAVITGVKKHGFDGVICGHIHHAAIKNIDGCDYLNTGDWVESCTAIAEDSEGDFFLIDHLNQTITKTNLPAASINS